MKPRAPYNWGPDYSSHWVWTGWDGTHKWIDFDGTVSLRPILPPDGCPPRAGRQSATAIPQNPTPERTIDQ